jgi:hypothetical protein
MSASRGLVVDITGGQPTPGSALEAYPNNGGYANQKWAVTSVGRRGSDSAAGAVTVASLADTTTCIAAC